MTQGAMPVTGGGYHQDFRLSITKALGDQLSEALGRLGTAPLDAASVARLHDRPGVYQLYLDGEFVYVGKADASLPARLGDHLRKISGRRNIDLASVSFSCLYVAEDFSALAPERLLINHHKGLGNIPWNNNGFGNKDPGRERDTTRLKNTHFDVEFPIDPRTLVKGLQAGRISLHAFLKALKAGLPYNFRYTDPTDSKQIFVDLPRAALSADDAFRIVSEALAAKWQITALMGYVIMYQESKQYKSAWRYYRAGVVDDAEPETTSNGGPAEDQLDLYNE
ncbi:GIY-YIG nuclease family protein [Nocardia sp. bgisy118]|uniref:GIY-YIG nuclease family protein n=1 Tax=Nocardia sp. bgisy118 TaxID=3413786 RepID=UPI003F4A7868